ncbi:unnamed protein product [Blepharisma stoltei]|uniref:WWE domain-containing protein n=1 Tax=Blepharisma stoltei TaxID=1481888 RepID=A0AAU9IZS0_9CILI|nr:unnamed protein product [Blepharisma stoltei]
MSSQQLQAFNNQQNQAWMNPVKPIIPPKPAPPPIFSYEQNNSYNAPKHIPMSGGMPVNPSQPNFSGQSMQLQGQQFQQAQVPIFINNQPRQVERFNEYPESSIESSKSSESSSIYISNGFNQSYRPQMLGNSRQVPGAIPLNTPAQFIPAPKQIGMVSKPAIQPSQQISQPFNISKSQPMNQPFSQPTNQPFKFPINQSSPERQPQIYEPAKQPNTFNINQPIREPNIQPISQQSQVSSSTYRLNTAPDDGPSSASQLGYYKPYTPPINQPNRVPPVINPSSAKWACYKQGIYNEFSQSNCKMIETAYEENKEYIVLALNDGDYLLDLKKSQLRKLETNSEPFIKMGGGLSWKWKNEDGNWWDYSPEDNEIIETAYKNYRERRGGDQVTLSNPKYQVNLKEFIQVNIETWFQREISRFVDDFNDKHSYIEF